MTALPHPVILTRPVGRNQVLARRLQRDGVVTLELPALALTAITCEAGRLPRPDDYDLVVFVSGAAARAYAEQLQHSAHVSCWPAHVPVACVGPASARSLRGGFWPPTLVVLHPASTAPRHDSEALWQVLQPVLPRLQRVLIVRAGTGREWLSERLRRAGVSVVCHAAYQRQAADWSEAACATLARWYEDGCIPVWLVTSAASLDAIHAQIVRAGWLDWWRTHCFVFTHPRLVAHLSAVLGEPVAADQTHWCRPDAADTARALRAASRVNLTKVGRA